MTDPQQRLAATCFQLAKALKWRRAPFDAKQIDALADYFYRVALAEAGHGEERIELVLGAIDVLSTNLCGPDFEGGEVWFPAALQTLMELIHPTGTVESTEGLVFLKKMERGIRVLRGEEDA